MVDEVCILVIATMDTKGTQALYLRNRIIECGKNAIIMDLSMREIGQTAADISADKVARAGGSTLKTICSSSDRVSNTEIMTAGAITIALKLINDGKIHGIIGIGGSTGSLMSTDVMRALPFGIPKLQVSSTAALPGLSTRYIGTGDIMLMHSVIEISGDSHLLRNVIDRAAFAICGMVDTKPIQSLQEKTKVIGITMLGPCEKCASRVQKSLSEKGLQVAGFSAAGISDRAMEDMIREGLLSGIVDLAPVGVLEHIVGGMRDAGPYRMESAGEKGIPQVISTGCVNFITVPKSKYTADHLKRRKYDLDKYRTWLRASPEELIAAARAFAKKLNNARGPVILVIPLKGWSSADYPGSETYDPQEDFIFIEELHNHIKPDIPVHLVDANMEDPEFATAVIQACEDVL